MFEVAIKVCTFVVRETFIAPANTPAVDTVLETYAFPWTVRFAPPPPIFELTIRLRTLVTPETFTKVAKRFPP